MRNSLKAICFLVVLTLAQEASLASAIDPSLLNIAPSATPSVQVTTNLTVAFDETLINSPRAATLRAQLGISRAAYAQALTLPNPSFFFLNDTAQKARQVGASIPIESPWKLAFRLLLAKSQIKLTDIEIQRNLWQLRSSVRRAYLDVVMAKETCATLEELQTLSATLVSISRRRFTASDVAAYDVERSSLANMQAEADYKQSLKRLEQARQKLTVMMGRDYHQAVDVQRLPVFKLSAETNELLPDFTKDLPSLDELVNDALKNRLDLKAAEQRIAVNKSSMRSAKANILPNSQFNIGNSYSGNPPDGPATRGYFIGVTQEIPIFNFQQGDIARFRAISIQLNRELEASKNIATEEVISAYQQLAAARERVGLFQNQIIPASEKVAKMARRGYEVGQNDITSTLAAQQANVQTKVSYLEAVRNYQQALTDLEQAIGHPLG